MTEFNTSNNNSELEAFRDQVGQIRDMAYSAIALNSGLTESTVDASPDVRHMQQLVMGMTHCTQAEDYESVVNHVLSAFCEFENSTDIQMLGDDDVKVLKTVFDATSAYNAQSTLMRVEQCLTESERTLDGGIMRDNYFADVNLALSRMINLESSMALVDSALSAHDTPPKKRVKF